MPQTFVNEEPTTEIVDVDNIIPLRPRTTTMQLTRRIPVESMRDLVFGAEEPTAVIPPGRLDALRDLSRAAAVAMTCSDGVPIAQIPALRRPRCVVRFRRRRS